MSTPLERTQRYISQITLVEGTAHLKKIRLYAEGEQANMLTDEQRELLGRKYDRGYIPKVNVCSTILEVETNRLTVLGQEIELPDEMTLNDDLITTLETLVRSTWKRSHMDSVSDALHYGSVRDGDGYIIVDWDAHKQAPIYCYNPAFDGQEGVYVAYSEPTNPESALYAFKMWSTIDAGQGLRARVKRLNVYWHDRIEFFITSPSTGQWQPYAREASEYQAGTTIMEMENPFVPGETYQTAIQYLRYGVVTEAGAVEYGEPLGLPVFHYAHNSRGMAEGVSGIRDLVPGLQDDINKAHIACIMAAELGGTPIMYATGYEPPQQTTNTTQGKPTIELHAGMFLYTGQPDASFGRLAEANISQLVEMKNDLIKNAATITSTPLTFFNMTGQLPAEGTLSALEDSLVAKVLRDQGALGECYARAAKYSLKLELAYGQLDPKVISPANIEELQITTTWKSPETRAMDLVLAESERKKNLGIPEWQLWAEMGYTPDQIQAFKDDANAKRAAVLGAISLASADAGISQPPAQLPGGRVPNVGNNGNDIPPAIEGELVQ